MTGACEHLGRGFETLLGIKVWARERCGRCRRPRHRHREPRR
jgi:hypothetical protein